MSRTSVLSFSSGSGYEPIFCVRTIEELDQNDGDLKTALDLMQKHNALHDTIERARHYGAIAKDALAIFPDDDYRKALTGIVDFCINRAY